jgi:hypothetical protein
MSAVCSEMEWRDMFVVSCVNCCSCFHKCVADLSVSRFRSVMEGGVLLDGLCLDRCSCFHESATYLIVSITRSDMEGTFLAVIPSIDCCSGFHQHATDLSMSFSCSEVEGCVLVQVHPTFIYIRSSHHKFAALLSTTFKSSHPEGRALDCSIVSNPEPACNQKRRGAIL